MGVTIYGKPMGVIIYDGPSPELERFELQKLVDKLDPEEVHIAIRYLANLLLAGAAVSQSQLPTPPPPNIPFLKGG